MAAAPSKPSPSNRPMDGEKEPTAAAGAKPVVAETTVPDSAVKPSPTPNNDSADITTASAEEAKPPTYESIEASEFFLLAKRKLNEGDFEEAMSLIEEGIKGTSELLARTTELSDEDIAIHEALAPLHYQYGTILLYSIEESDQEVTTAGSAVSAAVVEGGGVVAATAAANATAAGAAQEGDAPADVPPAENQAPTAADVDEDMQIAWENFEAARGILEAMLSKPHANAEKLELDLAQLCLREGDLQRMNGRNEGAIKDYENSLRLRKKSKFLDKFNRKIADVHYNLGMVHMNHASKDDETNSSDGDEEPNLTARKVKTEDEEKIKEAKREMACNKSVYHYLECSKCFCGQIALIANADPDVLTTVAQSDLDFQVAGSKEDNSPKYKTTGEEDEEMELPKVASSKLKIMRTRAKELVSTADLTTEKREEAEDLCQLLEEIQETIDEAENSFRGVHEVTNMKDEVSKLAAADGDIDTKQEEGNATTTIGFSGAAVKSGGAPATIATASTGATSASATVGESTSEARPMMVVKKKKKRAALEPVENPESKKPRAE